MFYLLCSQLEFAGRQCLLLLFGCLSLGVFDLTPHLVLQLREESLGGSQRLVLPLILEHTTVTISSLAIHCQWTKHSLWCYPFVWYTGTPLVT